ncbi:AAA-domain-containing protein [Piedraia hortae CBS 480.64]|uniref:AAA-domain-containing protein n=1 Tax=Piedraia hortae CBS 480.64 TaxID=1314780 RepID=A0A6A7BWW8_9PEZI|nr:AAA-domain-containing protein [Piedraia hortae CBS 480.64]
MRKGTPASVMQKTYDDCYLACSTAVFHESKNNEKEALRCWHNALDQIQYHNAYKMPSGWYPRLETEKALLDSLKAMEEQCKARVELLEALIKERKGHGVVPSLNDSPNKSGAPATKEHARLGDDNNPRANYADIPRPSQPERPALRPQHSSREATMRLHQDKPRFLSLQTLQGQSRTPSPDKKSSMLKTLRSSGRERTSSGRTVPTLRTVPLPAAAKAAAQVWKPMDDGGGGGRTSAVSSAPASTNNNANPNTAVSWDFHTRSLVPGNPWQASNSDIVNRPGSSDYHHHNNASPTRPRTEQPKPIEQLRPPRPLLPPRNPSTNSLQPTTHLSESTPASKPPPLVARKAVSQSRQIPAQEKPETSTEMEQDNSRKTLYENALKNLPSGVDEASAKHILNEIVIHGDQVQWDDVAGLDVAKSALKETVVYPFLRPDLFQGLREPARGMLLFGPPGTGKTMLARAVATESKSVFFAISASSLTSKYLGESEKLVRALFSLAKVLAPSIIFVDEIDSLLGSRGGSTEHESSRRLKTEFFIQWSDLQKAAAGRESKDQDDASRVLVLAATNLPWAIDEAARRRFVRRQYIPLPEDHVREQQLRTLLSAQKHNLGDKDLATLVHLTDGFSGSDITALAKDAAMGPLRSLGERLLHMAPDDIRPIEIQDFVASLVNIRPSVSKQGLQEFEKWAKEYGERGG